MLFSSLLFLYVFLPVCLACYFLLPGIRAKNVVLAVFSLLFYTWGEPVYILLMAAVVAVNWGFGLLIEKHRKKWLLIVCVALNLLCIGVFKYADFLLGSVNAVFGASLPLPGIALPIGISFYTFQALSYTVDVWRGTVPAQKSYGKFLLYVSLFPQLIAGPIVRYSDVEKQLEHRRTLPEEAFYGALRFCEGLAKKVLLADYCGKAAGALLDGNLSAATTVGAWLGVLLYSFEIYFDFSGYSDMAIGMGRIFGFRYPENFDLPYTAKSVTDFWRRWHISLSSFFRDYVYIPLGGNRRLVYRNLAVVWVLTGLWHGASWNFVLWGVFFFVLLALERLLKGPLSHVPGIIRRVLTLFLVAVSWDIFYFTELPRLLQSLQVLFGLGGVGFFDDASRIHLVNNLPLLLLCIFCSTPVPRFLGNALGAMCLGEAEDGIRHKLYAVLIFLFDLLLLTLSTVAMAGSSFNAFLYFRF